MKTVPSFSISAFLTVSFLLLAGCGGGGGGGDSPTPTPGGPSATYGSLTLSGTGTNVTGTTFNGVSRIGPTTMSQWYNVNISPSVTYPYVVLIVAIDNTGATMVDVNHMISSTQASGEWSVLAAPPGTVVATSTSVTFTNLNLSGYGSSPTTALTLNGTLTF